MTWFAFRGLNNGKAVDVAGIQEKNLVLQGFHGYATESDAEKHPNTVNIATRVLADVIISDYNASKPPGGGIGSFGNVPGNVTKAAGLTGIAQIGAVIKGLAENVTDPKMWRSLGWVALGIIFLFLGVTLWMKRSGYLPDMIPVPV